MKDKKEKNNKTVTNSNDVLLSTDSSDVLSRISIITNPVPVPTTVTFSEEDYNPRLTFRRPVYAGAFIIVEGFEINVPKKPNFIHLWFMKLVFGWEWKDSK